ncbi:MAG TPA: T9SS type A sorting domain-containing protein [Bacteroidales bacterium]|nr:T9SS type A sorting domain-containing protein [Bacteroidales bacterium]
MKKFVLIIALLLFLPTAMLLAQYRKAALSPELSRIEAIEKEAIKESSNHNATYIPVVKPENHYLKSRSPFIEKSLIGNTIYDLQSNATAPSNRLHLFSDGTMAAVWTRGITQPGFGDRGTGYNYFDGTAWGASPITRIESHRTGWPAYAPLGPAGEIVVAHHNTAGLVVSKRSTKGVGPWTETILAGPHDAVDISWPRMATSGPNNNSVHIIASTWSAYQGLNLALLYYRSTDAGATWDIEHSILPGMTATDFVGVSGDTWSFAEPQGDNLAFMVADNSHDMFIMRSADGGTTWNKITIWAHPYPGADNTPIFYCPDGAHHLAFDADGKLHVVFGINASRVEAGSSLWYPFIGGIGYWNENMEPWLVTDTATLNPDSLYQTGNLIAWPYDIDGNGQWDLFPGGTETLGNYGVGTVSMPQIVIDEDNSILVVFSAITEGFNNGLQNYRKIWAVTSPDGGYTWGDFHHLTEDLIHLFDECVFPTVAARTNNYFHIIYQADEEPGMAVRGDMDPYGDNFIYHIKLSDEIVGIGNPTPHIHRTNLSHNFPNPFTSSTSMYLALYDPAPVTITVQNIAGQNVKVVEMGVMQPGRHLLQVDMEGYPLGLYFATVSAGEQIFSRKMIVR